MRVGLLSLVFALVTTVAFAAFTDDFEKGKAAVNGKKNDEAIQIFTTMIDGKKLPNKDWQSQAYFYRGKAYKQKKDWDKAIADFSQSTQLAPGGASGFFELGVAYHNQKKYDQALSAFDSAIKLKPGSYLYHYSRCISNAWAGRPGGVISDCNKALELKPGYVPALLEIGRAYEDQMNCDKAEGVYNQVISSNPDNGKAKAGLEYIKELRKSTDPKLKCKK